MQYNHLQDLISHSNSSRQFFLSLPVSVQLMLHEHGNEIHSAADLHLQADTLEKHCRAVQISEMLF